MWVIGIHKAGEEKKGLNRGTFIGKIFKEINPNEYKKEPKEQITILVKKEINPNDYKKDSKKQSTNLDKKEINLNENKKEVKKQITNLDKKEININKNMIKKKSSKDLVIQQLKELYRNPLRYRNNFVGTVGFMDESDN